MEWFSLGERIMIYRKRRKLTKKELAELAGVTVATIRKYENDEVEYPDYDLLSAFSVVLGVSMNYLLMGIESPKRRKELEMLIKTKNDNA